MNNKYWGPVSQGIDMLVANTERKRRERREDLLFEEEGKREKENRQLSTRIEMLTAELNRPDITDEYRKQLQSAIIKESKELGSYEYPGVNQRYLMHTVPEDMNKFYLGKLPEQISEQQWSMLYPYYEKQKQQDWEREKERLRREKDIKVAKIRRQPISKKEEDEKEKKLKELQELRKTYTGKQEIVGFDDAGQPLYEMVGGDPKMVKWIDQQIKQLMGYPVQKEEDLSRFDIPSADMLYNMEYGPPAPQNLNKMQEADQKFRELQESGLDPDTAYKLLIKEFPELNK